MLLCIEKAEAVANEKRWTILRRPEGNANFKGKKTINWHKAEPRAANWFVQQLKKIHHEGICH